MQFNIINTQDVYRRLLSAPDEPTREAIVRNEFVAPFAPMVQVFGGDGMASFAQWGMYRPEYFVNGGGKNLETFLERMTEADAWAKTGSALHDAKNAFAPYMDKIALDSVLFGLFYADLSQGMLSDERAYSGFGAFPGYVMVAYGVPNAYNLTRLQGATVHELHHNIRFTLFPFHPMTTTVAEYIIAEGLAESFAHELYGELGIGYYVTDFNDAEIDTAKRIIGEALDVTGFNEIRSYVFGDAIAESMGLPKTGLPNYSGYAIGYRVVQQYLQRTGKSVTETTLLPADQIITESGYFA